MIYLKLLGTVLVAFSGIMLPHMLNRRLTLSLRQAEGWERLIGAIKTEVECFSLPISDILARADPSLLSLCGYAGRGCPKDLTKLLEQTIFSDPETEGIVRRVASEFGQCYKTEQVERCAYFLALTEARRKAIATELPAKKRLNSTLCISACLGILILFL